MKEFTLPEIEIVVLEDCDVVTTSDLETEPFEMPEDRFH